MTLVKPAQQIATGNSRDVVAQGLSIEQLGVDPRRCLQPAQFPCDHCLHLVRADSLCGSAELLRFPNPFLRFGQAVKYWAKRVPNHADDRVLVRVLRGHAWFWNHLESSFAVPGAHALYHALLSRFLCSIASHDELPWIVWR